METVVRSKKSFHIGWKELWSFRDLFYVLAVRDIKVRYKQSAIGISWAILQPLLMMAVFSVFFGKIAGIETGEIPYPIFVYSGLLFWNYFSLSLSSVSESMVSNQAMVQKVYFPRLIIPISSSVVHLVDFFFAFAVFLGLLAYYHFTPSLIGILLIVPALMTTFLAFLGIGLILTSLNVKYRDVRYALPYFIQLLLFVTPVIYPATILGKHQWLWYLNPMSGVIETMRRSLLGIGSIDWQIFGASLGVSIVIFIVGLIYFNRTEKFFADII